MLSPVLGELEHDDFAGWVARLADLPRAKRAYWHLVLSGEAALPAVRTGLSSPDPVVRAQCTKVLDHLVDDTSFPLLIAMLTDSAADVRLEALHALACDRCKDNACRPAPDQMLGPAITILRDDPNRRVRQVACELVGRWVHSHSAAAEALAGVAASDPDAAVRKKASWYAPGGTIHRKTRPRDRRASRR